MTHLLDNLDAPRHYFQPVYRSDNRMIGMEIMTCLMEKHTSVYRCHTGQLTHLDAEQQIALFSEKIALIERFNLLLTSWNITVWVNINDLICNEIMRSTDWVTRLQRLPFLTLTINEDFPGIAYGRNNLRLTWLADKFSLALANLGAGVSSNRAIFDGLFQHIFLDQAFIHNQAKRLSFTPFANAIIRQIAPYCAALLVSGINDVALYHQVHRLNFSAMQGNLWPAITPQHLASLFSPSASLQ